MKHKAFTMAEVLITLGIIGIVAAMTLPALVAKYQKNVTSNRLKKIYSTLSQALNRSQVDNGDIEQWEWEQIHGTSGANEAQAMEVFASKYFIPYFAKLKKDTYTTLKDFGYKNSLGMDTVYQNVKVGFVTLYDNTILIIDFDAVEPDENNPDPVLDGLMIYADINGLKNPNTIGSDIFPFKISTSTGKFMPDITTYNRSELIDKCENYEQRGYFCTALIMNDGWEISETTRLKFDYLF